MYVRHIIQVGSQLAKVVNIGDFKVCQSAPPKADIINPFVINRGIAAGSQGWRRVGGAVIITPRAILADIDGKGLTQTVDLIKRVNPADDSIRSRCVGDAADQDAVEINISRSTHGQSHTNVMPGAVANDLSPRAGDPICSVLGVRHLHTEVATALIEKSPARI